MTERYRIFERKNLLSLSEIILKEPHQVQSTWRWSWSGQWRKRDDKELGKVPYYTACDTSLQQDRWLRSNVFLVGNASRVDVTVQYAAYDCSSIILSNCKQNLKLFIYKTNIQHTIGGYHAVPEPPVKPHVYHLFGTTLPTNLTSSGSLSRDKSNTETYSFLTNSSTPYHYLAIKYEGGCFALYSVIISYSVCASLALPTGLIQLPRTMAPVKGSIQVSGSCAANAQPLVNNAPLFGNCNANGEWSSNVTSGKCWCKADFGKYWIGSGAECKGCPNGTYQEKASNKECKPCPLNSVQDVNRTKCNCASSFYRTKDESMYDNCTGQPSAPRDVKSIFKNSSYVTVEWTTPLDLGGRPDVHYQVECNKCNNDGKNCYMDCTGAVVTHTPRTSRKATVQHLSTYTYYQLKVFSKNGVSHLAEINGQKSKFAVGLVRTSDSVPSVPVLTMNKLNTTSVLLSWAVPQPNGVIIYYQISYHPVGKETKKTVLNTTKTSVKVTGLSEETKYLFQVRAATRAGLGPVNSQQIDLNTGTNDRTGGTSTDENKPDVTVPVLASLVALLLLVGIACGVIYVVRRKRILHREKDSTKTQYCIDGRQAACVLRSQSSMGADYLTRCKKMADE